MRSSCLHSGLLAVLLFPVLVTGGFAAVDGAGIILPEPPGGAPVIPLFPNVSFTVRTMAARDWYEQGFTLTNEERYGEALLAYEKALSLNRSLLNAWYYSGDALFRLGRFNEALLAFENATAVDPDFVEAYFYESLVYGRLGRHQDGKDALRQGLEVAERRGAKEAAEAHPAANGPGAVPEPVSPGTALLGMGLAVGIRTFVRPGRGS